MAAAGGPRLLATVAMAMAVLISASAPPSSLRGGGGRSAQQFDYKTRYFDQKIDHFGFVEDSTFKQRYLIANKYWNKDGGPILFYTGNEGDIAWFCNNTGFMWDISKELGAMLVFAEHRYYGESLPFGKKTFSNLNNLNYFTSEQALADFAVLIRNLKETIPGAQNSPVIAIGGSYGGMLAAWFRMKYPNIVVGALAASAPIWLFEDLTPCEAFSNIVTKDFLKSGKGCAESIRHSWDAINNLSSKAEDLKFLSSIFHLCSPLQESDIVIFKSWLVNTWVNFAMMDYPYEANFLQPLPAWPIKVVCNFLRDPLLPAKSLLQNIYQAVNVYYNYTGTVACLNISETSTSNLDDQGWYYQTCTEMVMPSCTNGVNDMFEPMTWNLQVFSDNCKKDWGLRPRPHWMTTVYGGKSIGSHSNIIFSNGGLDPWSSGGVTKSISDTLVAIFIPEGAHHLDLRSNNKHDPPSVRKARALEVQYFKKWIKAAKTESGEMYNSSNH
ncbi:lysosomal Pro-X carboxypeptidase-like isoform X1 [Leucoraja erinacea]|uniref:lysosomal Pro-X carboxypeptidase-like isoform X1 n=1 Tax=Leucoraja erinaceus TaxID=7782 RepID=UPI0024586767|nr:lysosomal Pro-X carboxypeptidase-like isoform X1 [Leucoraja erinacea]